MHPSWMVRVRLRQYVSGVGVHEQIPLMYVDLSNGDFWSVYVDISNQGVKWCKKGVINGVYSNTCQSMDAGGLSADYLLSHWVNIEYLVDSSFVTFRMWRVGDMDVKLTRIPHGSTVPVYVIPELSMLWGSANGLLRIDHVRVDLLPVRTAGPSVPVSPPDDTAPPGGIDG